MQVTEVLQDWARSITANTKEILASDKLLGWGAENTINSQETLNPADHSGRSV
jgi:hypothetical protein